MIMRFQWYISLQGYSHFYVGVCVTFETGLVYYASISILTKRLQLANSTEANWYFLLYYLQSTF